jgi:hypothetical protein
MSEKKKGERLRGAALFLAWLRSLGDGLTARELGNELDELLTRANAEALDQGVKVKGEMVIKFKLDVDPRGVATVTVESKVTAPKKPTPGGIGWMLPDGTWSSQNPKQTSFDGLREVVRSNAVRDEDDDSGFGS